MVPYLGSVVIYRLTAADAEAINRRRTTDEKIAKRVAIENWCIGAQAHIGNKARASQEFPMMVVAISKGENSTVVNGQVFLDGNDVLWVQGVSECTELFRDLARSSVDGKWYWPPISTPGCGLFTDGF